MILELTKLLVLRTEFDNVNKAFTNSQLEACTKQKLDKKEIFKLVNATTESLDGSIDCLVKSIDELEKQIVAAKADINYL